jgi:YD repeat-containing protein
MVERDGTGNIVGQKSYSYDSGNKLLQEVANGVTTVYQYDPNGNTVSKATGTSQVRYYWDDEDKMVRVGRQCGDELQGGWVGIQEVQGGRGAISKVVCV